MWENVRRREMTQIKPIVAKPITYSQDSPLGGDSPWWGILNPEYISYQDYPPQLLCFFMYCLCLIRALGEYLVDR